MAKNRNTWFLSTGPLGLPIFHLGTKFGAKMLIETEIMAQHINPRWRPSAILDFRKPDFWTLGTVGLPIFHLGTKFGAKMLIDAEIMAKNRNSRWRPSAILDLLHHHIGHPRSLFIRPHRPVKFYANPMHSFEDMTILIFCKFGLKCLFTPPKFRFFGVWTPKRDWSSSRPLKGKSLAGTALTWRFWWRSVKRCDLGASRRNQKRQGKKLTVANWVFAQTTHVDAAICGLACRVVFGR